MRSGRTERTKAKRKWRFVWGFVVKMMMSTICLVGKRSARVSWYLLDSRGRRLQPMSLTHTMAPTEQVSMTVMIRRPMTWSTDANPKSATGFRATDRQIYAAYSGNRSFPCEGSRAEEDYTRFRLVRIGSAFMDVFLVTYAMKTARSCQHRTEISQPQGSLRTICEHGQTDP